MGRKKKKIKLISSKCLLGALYILFMTEGEIWEVRYTYYNILEPGRNNGGSH